ncbi:MAG TPA: 16S rRNA (cytosine(967)-C(5))-methyltransferase RsmB [Ignavibacteria bacterium]
MNKTEIQNQLKKNPRWVSSQIISRVENTDSYLDKLIENEFKSDNLNDKDKKLLNELTNGVIRNKLRIDWVIKQFYKGDFIKINPVIKNTLRVAIYQFLFCDKIPEYAIVNEAVESIKLAINEKQSKLVNAILRNILRQKDKISFPDPDKDRIQYLSVYHSHPDWLVKRWVDRYGYDSTEIMLVHNNKPKDTSIRINFLKTNREKVELELISKKIKFERTELSDRFLTIKNIGELSTLELFTNGEIYVQDISAGLPVILLDPKEGERIIDFCAAPGGKTTFIAEIMKNKGEIIAIDVYDKRLKILDENSNRLGISIIKSIAYDARTVSLDIADRVLVDAPCSGFGTLSKKPDIKWKQNWQQVEKLNQLQYEILCNASRHVKAGGVLVYSTCTIEPEENENIISKFLESHTNFEIENANNFISSTVVNEQGFIQTLPHIHNVDGSFAARLRRMY